VTESQAFTITSGGGADLWADVIGPSQVRVGRPARFTVLFGNRGTVDAEAVPLLVTIPAGIALEPRFAIAPPPSHPSQVATDWTQVPAPFVIDDLRYLPLVVPVVPAGFTLALEVTVTPPPARSRPRSSTPRVSASSSTARAATRNGYSGSTFRLRSTLSSGSTPRISCKHWSRTAAPRW
jgi:uncharacterized repeat protein (TIGR01451 family)